MSIRLRDKLMFKLANLKIVSPKRLQEHFERSFAPHLLRNGWIMVETHFGSPPTIEQLQHIIGEHLKTKQATNQFIA